jgi:serine phosphatase RsbU (regulator of sigma subunit)
VSEEYGEDRLAGVIARCAGCSARMTVDRIHADVVAHAAGATQSDDITLMVVRSLGQGG